MTRGLCQLISRWIAAIIGVAGFTTGAAHATDAYVLGIGTDVRILNQNPCTAFRWSSEALFHNVGPTAAIVSLLGISNGQPVGTPQTLDVAPGRSASVMPPDLNWAPSGNSEVFVMHLDVPDGVLVAGHVLPEGSQIAAPCGDPGTPLLVRGTVPLPVVRQLTPANTPKYFLGADLGDLRNQPYATIYNADASPATATVQVFRTCDDRLLGSETIVVPANTVIQTGLPGIDYNCRPVIAPNGRYIVITETAPGFSVFSAVDQSPFRLMEMTVLPGQ